MVGRLDQSVQRLATFLTVWESNPGVGEILRTLQNRTWGPLILLYNGYWDIPGVSDRFLRSVGKKLPLLAA